MRALFLLPTLALASCDPGVRRCVAARLGRIRFSDPRPAHHFIVHYTFHVPR
jgi:hypothetical protein